MQPIEVRCPISEADLRHFLESKGWFSLWAARVVALTLPPYLAFLYTVRYPRSRSAFELVLLLTPILLLMVFSVYLGFFHSALMSRSMLKKNNSLREGSRYNFSETGIEIESPDGSGCTLWTGIAKATEDKRMFLLYLQNGTAVLLPKNCFGGEIEIGKMRTILRAALQERARILS